MDLKQLSYFMAVVEEGSISAAARRLHLSQPPLSLQIRQLEDELGCILFERTSRHIQLTEAGKVLYARAQTLLSLADSARRELTDYQNGTSGTLRLGVVSSVSGTLLQDWLISFHEIYPQVRYEITDANTYQLLEHLHSGRIELAIIRTPFTEGAFQYRYLPSEPMLAAGLSSFWTEEPQESISLESLAKKPLIVYRRWEQVLISAFEHCHLQPSVLCKNDDARTTLLLARSGLGVGIVPSSARTFLPGSNVIFKKIACDELCSQIAVACNPTGYLSTLAQKFSDHIFLNIKSFT